MGTKILVFCVVAVIGGGIVSGLVGTGHGRTPKPTRRPSPERTIAPGARELRAGPGIWSAWPRYPPRANIATTVLWRVAGTQPRNVSLGGRATDGTSVVITLPPTRVIPPLAGAGLSWQRPGVEWGSKVVFPHPGAWTLDLRAGRRRGLLTVQVVE